MINKHSNHSDNSHGTYKSYIIGFALSIALTLASYFIVTLHNFSVQQTYISITILGVAQLLVQLIFFLHLTSETKPRWNMMSFVFTAIMTFLLAAGSLWVMYNLNNNMM